jgi:hypothetical protein
MHSFPAWRGLNQDASQAKKRTLSRSRWATFMKLPNSFHTGRSASSAGRRSKLPHSTNGSLIPSERESEVFEPVFPE